MFDSYTQVKQAQAYSPTVFEEVKLLLEDRGRTKAMGSLNAARRKLETGSLKDEEWLSAAQLRDELKFSKPFAEHLIEQLEDDDTEDVAPTLERLMHMLLLTDERMGQRFADIELSIAALVAQMAQTAPPPPEGQAAPSKPTGGRGGAAGGASGGATSATGRGAAKAAGGVVR